MLFSHFNPPILKKIPVSYIDPMAFRQPFFSRLPVAATSTAKPALDAP
jgi:hypothetical protein